MKALSKWVHVLAVLALVVSALPVRNSDFAMAAPPNVPGDAVRWSLALQQSHLSEKAFESG